ncbi:phosphoribosylanthranilate isomerase [Bacillus ectoiniformans]|uniref:phosphoribosylanthranilate isomerase n=1 Tax=Bacillus ectoiniformans TaxID=1494429 RepID=UPI00195DD17D|nr:phosphoribosylanthranilate isomerase [Bacillus ectoiniformans]MBM7647744.1 phosphoribosylanthranilate isomerase [Bacillus ectoiniformans]
MKVKICGIQDQETAIYAQEAGADALGFVFAESKRKVTAEEAARINQDLTGVLKVGVFVNEDLDLVRSIAQEAQLDFVQLHGEESADYAKKLKLPTIKAFNHKEGLSLQEILQFPADYILIDSAAGPYKGGNGTTFDWKSLSKERFDRSRLILAGGLDPENIAEAIHIVRPYAVDVSSGVETNGKKDLKKIQSFINAAKGVNQL